MKKYLLATACFCLYNFAMAQTQYEDVVFLKNGSIIRGVIIEMIPNQTIKIKSDRNIFVYKFDEIQKTTKEEIQSVNVQNKTISNSLVTSTLDAPSPIATSI